MDPVNPKPATALFSSYSYQSPFSAYTTATYLDASSGSSSTSTKEEEAEEDAPPAAAPLEEDEDAPALPDNGKGKAKARERWVMGIDEAGRGPVLGSSAPHSHTTS